MKPFTMPAVMVKMPRAVIAFVITHGVFLFLTFILLFMNFYISILYQKSIILSSPIIPYTESDLVFRTVTTSPLLSFWVTFDKTPL